PGLVYKMTCGFGVIVKSPRGRTQVRTACCKRAGVCCDDDPRHGATTRPLAAGGSDLRLVARWLRISSVPHLGFGEFIVKNKCCARRVEKGINASKPSQFICLFGRGALHVTQKHLNQPSGESSLKLFCGIIAPA